jgi:hypothetical protein
MLCCQCSCWIFLEMRAQNRLYSISPVESWNITFQYCIIHAMHGLTWQITQQTIIKIRSQRSRGFRYSILVYGYTEFEGRIYQTGNRHATLIVCSLCSSSWQPVPFILATLRRCILGGEHWLPADQRIDSKLCFRFFKHSHTCLFDWIRTSSHSRRTCRPRSVAAILFPSELVRTKIDDHSLAVAESRFQ